VISFYLVIARTNGRCQRAVAEMEDAEAAMAQDISCWYVNLPTSESITALASFSSLRNAGQDLQGNTFWEFKDKLNAQRLRRIVRYPRSTHYADVKIPPQWHQWLKHTRYEAPTIEEQQADLVRQGQLKYLAQLADERWANKPSYIDKPKDQVQTAPEQNRQADIKKKTEVTDGAKSAVDASDVKPKMENPWAKHASNLGQNWQPESWTPGLRRRPE
jgi:NADH dehydrogenase [ubiquinone] 1 alpha subcomplex assembly factor 2